MMWRTCMARISEELKNDILYYIHMRKEDLDHRFIDLSYTSKNEVDAVYECQIIIKQNRLNYLRMKDKAPYNPKANRKAYDIAVLKGNSDSEKYEIHSWAIQEYPLSSFTKTIKDEILALCTTKLTNAGFGKKRRKISLPILTNILIDSKDLFYTSGKNNKFF